MPDTAALTEAVAREVIALHGGVVTRRISPDGTLAIQVALPIVPDSGLPPGRGQVVPKFGGLAPCAPDISG
jgi:hypothetical protein